MSVDQRVYSLDTNKNPSIELIFLITFCYVSHTQLVKTRELGNKNRFKHRRNLQDLIWLRRSKIKFKNLPTLN